MARVFFKEVSPQHAATRREMDDKPLVTKYAANELKTELNTKIDEFSNSREISSDTLADSINWLYLAGPNKSNNEENSVNLNALPSLVSLYPLILPNPLADSLPILLYSALKNE